MITLEARNCSITKGQHRKSPIWCVLPGMLCNVPTLACTFDQPGGECGCPSFIVHFRSRCSTERNCQLFGVKPWDPIVLALAPLTLGLAALLASAIPARRAAGVEPMVAL